MFAISVITAPVSEAAKGTKNGRAACGEGYKLNKAVKKNQHGKKSKYVVVEVYEKGTKLCVVSVKTGKGKGKKDKKIGVLMNFEAGNYHVSDEGKYKYYAGPLKKDVGDGGCITAQGWYRGDNILLFTACEKF